MADEHRRDLLDNNIRLVLREGAADAVYAVVGLDLHKIGGDAEGVRADLLRPAGAFGFVFRVDVQRADQPFFPEFAFVLEDAFEFKDADCCDFHWGSPFLLRISCCVKWK